MSVASRLVTGLFLAAVVLVPAAPMEAAAARATATGTAAAPSPLDALPAGRAPRAVPYAVGTRVYFNGRVTDVSARFDQAFPAARLTPAQRQLTTVIGGAGQAWIQLTGPAVDIAHVVGRIGPRGGWTGFHSSSGAWSRLAVTSTGRVVMPENGWLYRADGRFVGAFTGSTAISCGFCAVEAAGPHLVVERRPDMPGAPSRGTWLWSPPAAPRRLPDGYRAAGRLGAGWLAAPDSTSCWRVVPAAEPMATRARICSQTLPLVSADGARAVVVQAGRLRVVDTRTARGLGLARLPALPTWSPGEGVVRYVVPTSWETADSYLAVARDDRVLALVRCSVRTGRCERVVRATVRTGVDRIVVERGAGDAIALPAR